MVDTIRLRPAVKDDFGQVLEVFHSAWDPTTWFQHAFPTSDPESAKHGITSMRTILDDPKSDVIIAEDTASKTADGKPLLVGWVRWIRRLHADTTATNGPPPHAVLQAEDYPPTGDQQFALRVRQASADALSRYIQPGESCWYCSGLATRREYQRKGVATRLVRYGIERADEDGFMAYVTGTDEARALYEKAGFAVVDSKDVGYGVTLWFMRRNVRKG